MRWWPPHPDPHIITTRHGEALPIGSPCRVSPKPFLVTSPNSTHPSCNSPGMSPSRSLTSTSQPHLPDLNANTPLSPFVNRLCHSASNTPSNVLDCCLRQSLYRKPHQTYNQLPTLHAPRLIRSIITHHANPAARRGPRRVKTTKQIRPITAIRNSMKKGYIRLTKTR